MTLALDDFTTHAHSDEFASEWEEQQEALRASQFDDWLEKQEQNYWENLAKKSEGFSCTH